MYINLVVVSWWLCLFDGEFRKVVSLRSEETLIEMPSGGKAGVGIPIM